MVDEVFQSIAVKELIDLSRLKLASGIEVANATQTITISALGPAAVGTATIAKWLKVVGSDGVDYYIPMWT